MIEINSQGLFSNLEILNHTNYYKNDYGIFQIQIMSFRIFSLLVAFISFLANNCYSKNELEFVFVPSAIHFSDKGEPNEDNDLIGVRYNKWGFATYENSQFDRTYTISYDFYGLNKNITEKISLSAKIPFAIAHGYDRNKAVNLFGFVGFVYLDSSIKFEINEKISIRALTLLLPTLGGGAIAPGIGLSIKL